ncbi:NADH:ubiquinone oxidoreductase [Loktanella sp. D2R18]|uniref:NADH:ubiquinone oxidoreductase n=1 Tax=Rhodobacterales TaxID=204455 RepID=UPI000DE86F41|nr:MULTISPECIES: NADH:ubiquinone oxidoreductase [Rhodobacterales]MDO6589823.1 NADH:ubiquinone oxidoreductase [Yoonia sp. 1_MG-2023]RBW44439.1 NADH:ubiquinone oxidoreductase [Loktanella sp. D2R18]
MNELKPITQRMLFIAGGIGAVFAILLLIFSKFGFFGALFIGLIVAAAILFAMMMGLLDAFVGEDAPAAANPVEDVPPSKPAPKAESTPEPTEEPEATPEAEVIPEPEAAAEPEPKMAVEPAPIVEPAPEPMPADEPVFADEKPAGLEAARAGGADDLKKIKGVGPKLETMLNGMGFYHFDQIAAWGPAEQKWVDENLPGFKGRATRDKWVEQAKTLAAG